MVCSSGCWKLLQVFVSVLALSSRFDGQVAQFVYGFSVRVSVLALSSRFDGLGTSGSTRPRRQFQYSLCRVVLMVFFGQGRRCGRSVRFSTRSVESF